MLTLNTVIIKLSSGQKISSKSDKIKAVMKISEESLDYLEAHIPELAEVAIKQAYWAALASGSSVIEVREGALEEFG